MKTNKSCGNCVYKKGWVDAQACPFYTTDKCNPKTLKMWEHEIDYDRPGFLSQTMNIPVKPEERRNEITFCPSISEDSRIFSLEHNLDVQSKVDPYTRKLHITVHRIGTPLYQSIELDPCKYKNCDDFEFRYAIIHAIREISDSFDKALAETDNESKGHRQIDSFAETIDLCSDDLLNRTCKKGENDG